MGQGRGKSTIQVGHHIGDPLLGRGHAPILGGQPEIPAEGGLDGSPVEDLSLDFRGFHSLSADEFDDEAGPLILSDMLQGADDDTRFAQKTPFPLGERPLVPLKARPSWLLPIPLHEEWNSDLSIIYP
jgi:hypothetical protein